MRAGRLLGDNEAKRVYKKEKERNEPKEGNGEDKARQRTPFLQLDDADLYRRTPPRLNNPADVKFRNQRYQNISKDKPTPTMCEFEGYAVQDSVCWRWAKSSAPTSLLLSLATPIDISKIQSSITLLSLPLQCRKNHPPVKQIHQSDTSNAHIQTPPTHHRLTTVNAFSRKRERAEKSYVRTSKSAQATKQAT